ncbi:hypothetical protein NEFER01_1435 [Nematocida sp. LUAm1]|nr:hypothetical protein NEFER02_1641 [Nematocida sp. LUAm2]KAI5178268.1 hypothetical protein NEFER01_1435 [Nematocida sp. LUAm1]
MYSFRIPALLAVLYFLFLQHFGSCIDPFYNIEDISSGRFPVLYSIYKELTEIFRKPTIDSRTRDLPAATLQNVEVLNDNTFSHNRKVSSNPSVKESPSLCANKSFLRKDSSANSFTTDSLESHPKDEIKVVANRANSPEPMLSDVEDKVEITSNRADSPKTLQSSPNDKVEIDGSRANSPKRLSSDIENEEEYILSADSTLISSELTSSSTDASGSELNLEIESSSYHNLKAQIKEALKENSNEDTETSQEEFVIEKRKYVSPVPIDKGKHTMDGFTYSEWGSSDSTEKVAHRFLNRVRAALNNSKDSVSSNNASNEDSLKTTSPPKQKKDKSIQNYELKIGTIKKSIIHSL